MLGEYGTGEESADTSKAKGTVNSALDIKSFT
jgi:hypothetical protein